MALYILKNLDEFLYYFETLRNMGYIEWQQEVKEGYIGVRITLSGLEKLIVFQQIKLRNIVYCNVF
jgi:hypothetical protein